MFDLRKMHVVMVIVFLRAFDRFVVICLHNSNILVYKIFELDKVGVILV